MRKIVIISDTHGNKIPHLPKADILIHCGDWSGIGSEKQTLDLIAWLEELEDNYKAVYAVPGNHDIWVYNNEKLAKQLFLDSGIELLIDQATWYEDLMIYGMPHSPQFGNWAYMPSPEKREMAVSIIPDDTDILITHAPPHGYLDQLDEHGSNPGSHVGCTFLAKRVEEIAPLLHCFGHIHNQSGVMFNERTLFVNAASVTEQYKAHQGYKVVYI